jgi:hypothetical protein
VPSGQHAEQQAPSGQQLPSGQHVVCEVK